MDHIPPITLLVLLPVLFIIGGFGRRIAGGYLNQVFRKDETAGERVMGDHPARLIFAATCAIAFAAGGAELWHAAAMIPLYWIGTTSGNFESLDLGRGKTSFIHDFLGMSAHGLLSGIAPALFAWYFAYEWWPIMLSNLLIAPAYMAGWATTGIKPRKDWRFGLQGGTELAEFYWGGLCAVGAFFAAWLCNQ